MSPELIYRLGDIGFRVFSTAAKNIEKQREGSGYFDRVVYADEGCTQNVIDDFDKYIKVRGQELLEELDVWFSSHANNNKKGKKRKGTGLYMVHYVEDPDEKTSLKEILSTRGIESENGLDK